MFVYIYIFLKLGFVSLLQRYYQVLIKHATFNAEFSICLLVKETSQHVKTLR
jgi:hypothetical protein